MEKVILRAMLKYQKADKRQQLEDIRKEVCDNRYVGEFSVRARLYRIISHYQRPTSYPVRKAVNM